MDRDPRQALYDAHRRDETDAAREILEAAALPGDVVARISTRARGLIAGIRERQAGNAIPGLDTFLQEYALSTREGVALMCLAEALLRIPDAHTADLLIRDKIGGGHWDDHLGQADSVFVNASTWALMLTGRLLGERDGGDWSSVVGDLAARVGEPVVREAVVQGMRILGHQFVLGRTIEEALDKAAANPGFRHSFDMLGEAALTTADAERYLETYAAAIKAIGKRASERGPTEEPGVSVKLSALHPRYEPVQEKRVLAELVPRLSHLAHLAAEAGIGLCVDAEESERLDLSLDVLEAVSEGKALRDWEGLGLALQTYQKRALAQVDWVLDVAMRHHRRIQVRLVKGAYWDAEVKRAQVGGFTDYPVFTRKAASDVGYIACAKKLLAAGRRLYPAFASHNAHTVAAVLELAGPHHDLEFQRLHGMGEELFDLVSGKDVPARVPCRIYAPVGNHEDLLPYLVRRLLENGSNTSFVNRVVDAEAPPEQLAADPVATLAAADPKPHPRIPRPPDLFGEERANSRGLDLDARPARDALLAGMAEALSASRAATPMIGAEEMEGTPHPIRSPQDRSRVVGTCVHADVAAVGRAFDRAAAAQPDWDAAGAEARAAILEKAATLYEEHRHELIALSVAEAGKTLVDSVAEVREAVDFLFYYAARARIGFGPAHRLPGPTGERDEIRLAGRGVFACISPWNFPLAIFTGQVSAALAAGNAVLAKPAGPTPLIAHRAIQFLRQAGVPDNVLHLLPGPGSEIGPALAGHPDIGGVAFTGSVETAHAINRRLAARRGAIAPLIAETGGQNAMIVDSSALPEQVVRDALASAFQSAGQRCSALRVLFVQDDVADKLIGLLSGAMAELRIGDPARPETDVGPLIDEAALATLTAHAERMETEATLLATVPMEAELSERGPFFAPRAWEIPDIGVLTGEVFGPALHIVRYAADRLDAVLDAVNATGFGLTLSVHSRIDATIERVKARARVGNLYVNRNQIGAVVGVQPFGGEGLSGTGPKAGGPRYLHRYAVERTVSTNTTASGGNASLMMLGDDEP